MANQSSSSNSKRSMELKLIMDPNLTETLRGSTEMAWLLQSPPLIGGFAVSIVVSCKDKVPSFMIQFVPTNQRGQMAAAEWVSIDEFPNADTLSRNFNLFRINMKILAWNTRSIGGEFKTAFLDIKSKHKPDLVIITEAEATDPDEAEGIVSLLGYKAWYRFDEIGAVGRVWIIWRRTFMRVDVVDASFLHVHASIQVNLEAFLTPPVQSQPPFETTNQA